VGVGASRTQRRVTATRISPARLSLALLALVASGCGREASPERARLIPARDSPSTATLARVEIDGESRYVLNPHPLLAVRARDAITLPATGALRVPVDVPASLAGQDVHFDGWLSALEQGAPLKTLFDVGRWRKMTLRAAPVVWRGHDGDGTRAPPAMVFDVPAALAGAPASLTVVARPLAAIPVERVETDALEVPRDGQLAFGYGVEEPGWASGWPPVLFRLSTVGGDPVALFERRIDPADDARERRWFDAVVDLAPIAGRRVRFLFEMQPLADAPRATIDRSFAVIANPEIRSSAGRGPDRRWSVILVSLDTLRARSVSAYGCSHRTSPALDQRLAAAGALVRFAVAPFPYTPVSHMSMLTGLEPCAHGVNEFDTVLPADRLTLAERLRAAGYDTAAFTEDGLLLAANGFHRGFDVYRENRSEESAAPGFAARTFADAAAWLADRPRRPFFLFIHTYQVHEPYTPPRGYASFFGGDERPEGLADYEREIRYTDDVLGDFLDVLDARGLADHTIVAVTSDHGQGFGEHAWGHGSDLHDEALLVPLVLRAPGLITAGRVVEEQVSLVDLTPTLLELVGLSAPPDIQGRSFASLLTGPTPPGGAAFQERPVISTCLTGSESVRSRQYKYLRSKGGERFYDLHVDPLESTNRAAENAALLPAARAMLDDAHASCARWKQAHPSLPGGSAPRVDRDPAWLVDRDTVQRKLRSLGYVQ